MARIILPLNYEFLEWHESLQSLSIEFCTLNFMLCTINDYEFLEWHELFSKKGSRN